MTELNLTGTVSKERHISAIINKGIGMGELPSATGQNEFPMPAYSVNGTDLTAVSGVVRDKAGLEEAPVWPEGLVSAVEGLDSPDPYLDGTAEHIVNHTTKKLRAYCFYANNALKSVTFYAVTGIEANCFQSCTNLESAVFPVVTFVAANAFRGTKLQTVDMPAVTRIDGRAFYGIPATTLVFPKLKRAQSDSFYNCTSLKTVTLGSLGDRVLELGGTPFSGCTQDGLTITVYVDAATLADIPAGVIGTAPWGATNATIVYRNSNTGEVITE